MKVFITALCIISGFVAEAQMKQLKFLAPKVYPEGVAVDDKCNVFYVSSVTTGTIGKVDMNGNYTIVYADSSLKSSFGMKVKTHLPGHLFFFIYFAKLTLVYTLDIYNKLYYLYYDLANIYLPSTISSCRVCICFEFQFGS